MGATAAVRAIRTAAAVGAAMTIATVLVVRIAFALFIVVVVVVVAPPLLLLLLPILLARLWLVRAVALPSAVIKRLRA